MYKQRLTHEGKAIAQPEKHDVKVGQGGAGRGRVLGIGAGYWGRVLGQGIGAGYCREGTLQALCNLSPPPCLLALTCRPAGKCDGAVLHIHWHLMLIAQGIELLSPPCLYAPTCKAPRKQWSGHRHRTYIDTICIGALTGSGSSSLAACLRAPACRPSRRRRRRHRHHRTRIGT